MIDVIRRGVSFKVHDNSPGIPDFWSWDTWEATTYLCMEEQLDKDHSYLDIGCHLGQTILYGCHKAKHCYAIEPDPVCLDIIQANIELNGPNNITLINAAAGLDEGPIVLGVPETSVLGNSRTSSYYTKDCFSVSTISVQKLIKELNITDLNFIKIDVEGMEDKILEGCGDLHIPMHLSMHTCWLSKGEEGFNLIMEFLKRYDNLYIELDPWDKDSVVPITLESLLTRYSSEEGPPCFFSIVAL